MMHRLASLCTGLALAALLTSGCFTQPSDGVFGPDDSLGGDEAARPALSLKASPARGPGPLEVEFSLTARDSDGGALAWALDFGDRTAPAAGTELPAQPRHTYTTPGAYVATLTVQDASGDALVSTLSIVVLQGLATTTTTTGTPPPAQGPEPPPQYSPPASSGGGGAPPPSASNTTTPPPPATNGTSTSSSTSSSTSTTTPPSPSSSTSQSSSISSSSSSTSETTTTSETSTSSGTSTSSSSSDSGTSTAAPEPTEDPTPTGSETSTSSDPPL